VLLGALLGEGTRYARYRLEILRNRRIIKTELRTVLSQLPQKRDILNQAIRHLSEQRVMPMLSVHAVTTGYRCVIDDLYPHLSLVERNCLHVIYERLRVADQQMDEFEGSFTRTREEGVINDLWTVYAERLEELLESYSVVEDLARSYVTGEPVDVFGVEAQR
jgi:hypothetical protein